MKRFLLTTTVLGLLLVATAPANSAVDFDQLRRENLEKDATYDELRRGYQEGVKAVDFDKLRRENLEKDAAGAVVFE